MKGKDQKVWVRLPKIGRRNWIAEVMFLRDLQRDGCGLVYHDGFEHLYCRKTIGLTHRDPPSLFTMFRPPRLTPQTRLGVPHINLQQTTSRGYSSQTIPLRAAARSMVRERPT